MNNIIKESERSHIIRKTGRFPKECKCKLCKQQCHTPCLGTPSDILKLMNAGYSDKLSFTDWKAGIVMGCTDHVVTMVQATVNGDWCIFYHDGLCELPEMEHKEYMYIALTLLYTAKRIYVIDGENTSKGVKMEIMYAETYGIKRIMEIEEP